MNNLQQLVRLAMLTSLLAACGSAPEEDQPDTSGAPTMQSDEERDILFYRHPMNPEITSPVPGVDSMGMPYVPVYADSVVGVFSISPNIVQNLGITTAAAEQGDLSRLINTVGYVTYNATLLRQVRVRTPGWLHQTFIHSAGEQITAGQKLFDYYAPELVTAQHEYLSALNSGNRRLIGASRERLVALGMAEQEIQALTTNREVLRNTGVYASRDAYVVASVARDGLYLTPGVEVASLAPLTSVWVQAEVFPAQMQWLAPGQTATVTVSGLPGRVFTGTLDYLAPQVDELSRTRTARLTLPNPDHALLPGAYATVRIEAASLPDVVHVPLDALIRTGETARVVLALGGGHFMSRSVAPGPTVGDRVVIREGLAAGEQVVTSAQFLLDSEVSLRQTDNRLDSAEGGATPDTEQEHEQHDAMHGNEEHAP